MNVLDSRFLRLGDCFAQKFSKAGSFKYVVTTAGGWCLPIGENAHTILVKPRPGGKTKGAQHNIVVKQENSKLVAAPAKIEIEMGDLVLWHTLDASTPGFAVIGEGEGWSFNSAALADEGLYSHAFGSPGHYEWKDANEGRVRGEIEVKSLEVRHPKDCKKWLEHLSKGTLIRIAGEKSEPSRIEIVAGQTVFWAVEKGTGITITDSRHIRGKHDQ
jgi:plastocyanin